MADDVQINIGANPAGVEAGSRRAKVALKGVADGGRDLDTALRKLRQSIDPTFAAMEKYNKAHSDNLALLRADLVTRREYNQAMKVAKAALDADTAAIQRNSAAGRAAIAEKKAAEQAARQAAAQTRAQELQEARAAAAEARRIQRETAAEAKRLKREELAAIRAAAAERKRLDREVAANARAVAAQERAELKASEAESKRVSREKANAEKTAAREAAAAVKAAEREKLAAVREANRAAAQAIKDRRAADRDQARASREAAAALQEQARAEKQAATAAQDLRASIDPAFAAQSRYNETMRRATQLLMQNKLATGEWNAIQRQARAQMDLNVRSLGQQNSMYVQLGYQAQDVTASLASGINPLVILAQQGGQTAAALSTMGGTVGRVAAFFAGPWGAAIIGATLLLGFLWDSMSEGETTTKDLMRAEDRRTMSVKELTTALRDYVNAQEDANRTTKEGVLQQGNATQEAAVEIMDKMTAAQERVRVAQERLVIAQMNPAAGIATAALRIELMLAERQVKSLQTAYELAQRASAAAAAKSAQTIASMSRLEQNESDEKTAALGSFNRAFRAAGADRAKQVQAQITYQTELNRIESHYTKLKEEEAKARRENAKAAREEEKATFQSRRDAVKKLGTKLQREGYSVDEGLDFGGITPGAHRSSHVNAIDVNIPGAGNEAANKGYRERMEATVREAQAQGYKVLWNGKVYAPHGGGPSFDIPFRTGSASEQHTNHAHFEAPKSIVGKPSGGKLAGELEAAQMRAMEEAQQALIADIEFKKELAGEDLAIVMTLQEQKIAAIQAFHGKESKEALDAQREMVRIERQASKEQLEEARRNIDKMLAMRTAAAEQTQALQEIDRGGQEDVIGFAESNGIITAQEAIQQRSALLDQEYQQQLAHETRMYQLKAQSIRDQLALQNLPAKVRSQLNVELETMEAEHLNRMGLLQAQYARNVNQAQLQTANITMQKWREVGQSLSQSMTSSFQGIWTHSQTLQQGFINAADQMVYKFVDAGAKMFEDWFMKQVGMTAVQQAQDTARATSTVATETAKTAAVAGATTAQTAAKTAGAATEMTINTATTSAKVASEGIKTAAAVGGAATQQSVGAAAGMAEIGTRAATSAAGAFSSTVVIPFIGPVAAPVAAAAALAAVLGFGALISAEGGMGEVPSDQLAMVHKKEMILPAWIAEPMRKSISARGSGGMMSGASQAGSAVRESMTSNESAANFYYQPKHTNMGAGFTELLRKDGREMRKWLKNEVRNGSFKV